MAIDVMNRIWWREDLPMLEKFVGLALADAADQTGVCWPAIDTLALKCSCSRRSVQNALRGLEGKQLLKRFERKDRSSYYQFNMANLPHVERPARLKERGLHDDLFTGAGDAPDLFATGAAGSGTGAAGSGTGAGDAPRTVIEPPLEPSGGNASNVSIDVKLDDDQVIEQFISCWNTAVASLKNVPAVTRIGGNQRTQLLARIGEYAPSRTAEALTQLFSKVTETIAGSLWLRGETNQGTWHANTLWVTGKKNFEKIMGDFYVQDAAAGSDRQSRGGGSVEVGRATRDALHARNGGARPSAREIAGLPRRGAARTG